MKYAGLATTMFATLFIAFWLGSKVDQYLGNETEYVGLVFVVATLVAIFYKLLKELS